MANLWRVFAIAWLGGVASPLLMEERSDFARSPSVTMPSDRTLAGAAIDAREIGDHPAHENRSAPEKRAMRRA
jgi:hypothetical protein